MVLTKWYGQNGTNKMVWKNHQTIKQSHSHNTIFSSSRFHLDPFAVGRDGALVESTTFNRRVVGSTPALAVT